MLSMYPNVHNPDTVRYPHLDTRWSSHCAAAAHKLKPKEPKQ